MTTARPSFWRPTPTSVPSRLNEKCRGLTPPAARVWRWATRPVVLSREKVIRGSEGMAVLLDGEGLGTVRRRSKRDERRRKFVSG